MEEIFNRKLTIEDVKRINELKPKFISVSSLDVLSQEVLLELDKTIGIRIVETSENKGVQLRNNASNKQEENKAEYYEQELIYSKTEVAQMLRKDVKFEIHSKELKGFFKNDIISLDSLKELKPLKISVKDEDFKELEEELKFISIYYPEILDNVEIENTLNHSINMQKLVDNIYEAKKVDENSVISPVNITVSSNIEEDFNLDFSKAPRIVHDVTNRVDNDELGQRVTFRNTDASKKIKLPAISSKLADSILGIGFEGFDVSGLDLRNSKVSALYFNNTTNIDKIILDGNVSFNLELNALTESELNAALTNFAIHNLNIKNINLQNRAILQELATNPELVYLAIHNAHLNNLDGLELFDGRLFKLNLQSNDLSVRDIERVENFRKTNPYLEAYLNANTNIDSSIRSLPEISDETYQFIKDYNTRTASKYKVNNKDSAIGYMLWSYKNLPYFIQDAKIIRDDLKITSNPMMVKDNAELDNFDFTQNYLKDGILYLTPEQVEHLIASGKSVPQNVRLKIESVADLSVNDINDLTSRASALGINISEVQIYDSSRHNNHNQIAPYKLSEYAYIRETLDIIVDGISNSDSDIDKFATIYQRLMDNITYDYDAIKSDNASEAKYYSEKRDSSRNLREGLEEGKCVCPGYADILRNALMMVGINAENVSGFTKRNSRGEEAGFHSWNMIELDDGTGIKKWYNTDLTWCAGKGPATMEKVTLKGDVPEFCNRHMPWSVGLPKASSTDFDRNKLRTAFSKARAKSFNVKDKYNQLAINIPEDPKLQIEILDQDRILTEYNRRKNDMCAKYYGDKEYKKEYLERNKRFKAHEMEHTSGGITYRKIDDYAEKEEDEKFLLLDKYSECLERMTRYQAGDTSVYQGNATEIAESLAKDKEYVETRNHTFNKNKNTRSSLSTLGKYGEKVPYIPKQVGITKNAGRILLNTGIFARNVVAPIYRGVGKYIAVPIHKLVVRDKDASPFRNNWYHRMVARRDYFTEKNNNMSPNHGITNGIKARVQAIFKAKEGNKAVLNAGAAEIQANIIEQERERNLLHSLGVQSAEFQAQIQMLQNNILAHPTASNIADVQKALQEKISKKNVVDSKINSINNNKTGISQTDAISDAQHDIAVKEEITLKTTVIKGFAKGLAVKYVGPKIHDWLSKRSTQTITEQATITTPVQKQRLVDATYKTKEVPIYNEVLDTEKTMTEIMETNAGKTVTGFYSVYGGEKGGASYTLTGNENITAIFQANGNTGTGFSDIVGLKAPTLVDNTFNEEFLTSSGLLNQDTTISQLLEIVNNGSVDSSKIANMYVSVGDRYWVKLSDLTYDLMAKVQTGTELQKVVDVAAHYENYTDYVEKVVNVTHTVTNDKFAKIADATLKTMVGADTLVDVDENLRFSKTNIRDNKKNPKNYNFNGDNEIPTNRKEYRKQIERDR